MSYINMIVTELDMKVRFDQNFNSCVSYRNTFKSRSRNSSKRDGRIEFQQVWVIAKYIQN